MQRRDRRGAQLMQLEMLLPERQIVTPEGLESWVAHGRAAAPFNDSIVEAIADLSRRIFLTRAARAYPELTALAYWMRKAEVTGLLQQFRALQSRERVLAPRGLAFHLPPHNVETMFVYSWLLAALTGNRNIIRLPPERSESTEMLLRLFRETLADAAEPARSSTLVVTYGHEAEITERLSGMCDVRVVWGGDQTIDAIRRAPLAPHAKELTFADRRSLCAIAVESYLGLAVESRNELVARFFNDAFWFNQLACSSPRLVAWCGSDARAARRASTDLFARVAALVESRHYAVPPAATMQKFVFACSSVLTSPVAEYRRYPGFSVLTLEPPTEPPSSHPGGGFFFEVRLENLADLASLVTRRDQTLTWFGFTRAELEALVGRLNGAALDRVVPIGQALQFNRFWDGYDLLQEFCRCVYLEASRPDSVLAESTIQAAIIR